MIERTPPRAGQESVWDYPRPPRLETVDARVRVVFAGVTVADTTAAMRVLETSHPPTYYIPLADIAPGCLEPSSGRASFCEWKGAAEYLDVVSGGRRAVRAAWRYPDPTAPFHRLKDAVAFYPEAMDACFVGDERARAQAGGFYGGWITDRIVGPFKGEPGTAGW